MSSHLQFIFGFVLLTAVPVRAAEPLSFQGLWDAVARIPDCKQSRFPDFILVTCEKAHTLWYFTKPNNPAYPGVIKRYLADRNGAWYAKEDGQSFGPDAAQPAFKAWMAQITELDRQASEANGMQPDKNSVASPK